MILMPVDHNFGSGTEGGARRSNGRSRFSADGFTLSLSSTFSSGPARLAVYPFHSTSSMTPSATISSLQWNPPLSKASENEVPPGCQVDDVPIKYFKLDLGQPYTVIASGASLPASVRFQRPE